MKKSAVYNLHFTPGPQSAFYTDGTISIVHGMERRVALMGMESCGDAMVLKLFPD